MTASVSTARSPLAEAPVASVDRTFRAMGCDVRVAAVAPDRARDDLRSAADRAERLVHAAAARLTRFDAASELRRLSVDPRATVPVSPLLAVALQTALTAARQTGGLLDPTLAEPISAAGYAETWDPARRADLLEMLALAPARRPAQAARAAGWQAVTVDRAAGTVTRPPGLQFDLSATAKGLIADLALRALVPVETAFVDAGGDVAIDGGQPQTILAADPFGRPDIPLTTTRPCGVATSSIAGRCWLTARGPAHHLLDPSTGRPAFTGVVQATAAAPTTALAEQLAGHALLGGPDAGARLLARHGGLLVLDDGITVRLPGALLR